MLKRWLLMGVVVGGIVVAGWAFLPAPAGKVVEGEVPPDFSLPDLAGVQQHLPKGKVVLLNFWATWCPPCRKEMPSMIDLHQRFKDKGLMIVAASVDKDRSQLVGFVREYNIPFQVVHDSDAAVSRRYGVFRYPESFLIDRNGKVRFHLIGGVEWTDKTVLKVINTLLAEKTAD
ncbi:MAG: TlpA disulfide reductase family protein [Mariprofundaceae bacterium]